MGSILLARPAIWVSTLLDTTVVETADSDRFDVSHGTRCDTPKGNLSYHELLLTMLNSLVFLLVNDDTGHHVHHDSDWHGKSISQNV